jgi:hypothetical protein
MTRHGTTQTAPSSGEGSTSKTSESITTGTTQRSGESQDTETNFAGEAVKRIETLVESFRTGNAKKSHTIVKIGQILEESGGSDEVKDKALDGYSSTLDGIKVLATRSNERGLRHTNSILGKRKENLGGRDQRHEEFDGNHPGDSPVFNIDNFYDGVPKSSGPSDGGDDPGGDDSGGDDSGGDDPEGESGSDDESGDFGERGRSNKKQRIYESQMPWFSAEQRIRKSNTNPSCNKTRSILDIFQRDTATVKRWIRCASTAPAGFPSTEWDALVKGESIDIDTVFSSLHHIHSIDEGVGHVGSTEIQFGRPKPAAKIETSGQWTAAFNLIVKATSFLFPHRYDELRQHGDYMEELFSAKSVAIHPKLFKYDEAIRYKVGQGQNILLTDRAQFTRYYEAIVASDGVGFEGTSEASQGNPRKDGKPREKSEICHRFNGAKGCSSTAEKCKYKHICKKCKSSGHGKVDCKVDEGV